MAVSRVPMLELTIEKPVAGGRMLARHEGQIVLVSGAIPGERIRARVEREAKRVVFAETVDVLEASPFRRRTEGDPACGGLLLSHVAYPHQLELKAAILTDTFARVGKLTLPAHPTVAASPERGYRMRARLHAAGGRLGFFREGTRSMCDAGPSGQLADGALAAAERALAALGEDASLVDAVTLAEDVPGRTRIVLLEPRTNSRLRVRQDATGPVEGLDGVSVLAGDRVRALWGAVTVTDSGDTLDLHDRAGQRVQWTRSVQAFFQSNRFMVGRLLNAVLAHVRGDHLADVYAGVGLFAVPLAARGAAVVAIEGDPASGSDLRHNAASWPSLETRLMSVEDGLARGFTRSLDSVVVDPPRTGLSPLALEGLRRVGAPRIVYVSCDPATLARDVAALGTSGYELTAIEAFDMFPNTPHIEAVAVLDSVSGR